METVKLSQGQVVLSQFNPDKAGKFFLERGNNGKGMKNFQKSNFSMNVNCKRQKHKCQYPSCLTNYPIFKWTNDKMPFYIYL